MRRVGRKRNLLNGILNNTRVIYPLPSDESLHVLLSSVEREIGIH